MYQIVKNFKSHSCQDNTLRTANDDENLIVEAEAVKA